MAQPRYRYRTSTFYGYFPRGVKWLLIVNTLVYVLFYLGGRSLQSHMLTLLALWPEAAVHNLYIWQLFTYMFLHGGTMHLLFNMLTLWFLGVQLEQDWGTRQFLKYYFYCGMAAGVCVLGFNIAAAALTGNPEWWNVQTLGASGAIFGVLTAFGVLYPDQTVLFILFPIKAKYMVMILAAVELLFILGPSTGVSNIAHLGGMAFGYLYLKRRLPVLRLPGLDVQGAYNRWRMARAKKKFQVYLRKRDGRGPWVN
ncbi:MAG: rhomboid family intramembrane serine protease [Bryobacteraceae bacterium]|jgi:membrane associated rhomboid family serine protease